MAAKKPTTRTMSNEHKAALAVGREEGRTVRAYLEALAASAPKRGRKRTPESVKKRLATVVKELPGASPMDQLLLTQEKMDLEAELAHANETTDISGLEKAFTKVAKSYGSRKGLTYSAWRSVGVPAAVLRSAGITRAG